MGNAAGWRAIRRRTLGRLPFVRLESDVTGVFHANWLIPAAHAAACVPRRVRLAEHAGGNGSTPSLALRATRAGARAGVPDRFARWFGADRDPLAVICLQDAAIVAAGPGALADAWIDLAVALKTIEPPTVETFAPGPLLTALGAANPPWCFQVSCVSFRVLGEHLLRDGPPLTNRSRPAWIAS